jgi:hypothetical protein
MARNVDQASILGTLYRGAGSCRRSYFSVRCTCLRRKTPLSTSATPWSAKLTCSKKNSEATTAPHTWNTKANKTWAVPYQVLSTKSSRNLKIAITRKHCPNTSQIRLYRGRTKRPGRPGMEVICRQLGLNFLISSRLICFPLQAVQSTPRKRL